MTSNVRYDNPDKQATPIIYSSPVLLFPTTAFSASSPFKMGASWSSPIKPTVSPRSMAETVFLPGMTMVGGK